MDYTISFAPTPDRFSALQERYCFQSEDGVTFPGDHANFINLPASKIPIYMKHFDVGYRLPTLEFFREVLHHHKVHINQLVPNGVNKVVVFMSLYWANGISLDIWVFSPFFLFCCCFFW